MSHFSVLVVGNDWEKQLAPYQENNMGDCPNDYLEFNDCTEEVKKGFSDEDDKYVKEYKTIEEYAEGYHGYSVHEGRFGYWENPDAKWDWYMMGGRWAGYFKLLPGAEGLRGENGVGESCNTKDSGWVDQARIKDIDFDAMQEKNREDARKFYNSEDFKRWTFDKSTLAMSEEEYVDSRTSWATFALLKDGEWYEKGEMGWFGFVGGEKPESDWEKEFSKQIQMLPPETLLTLVDCHI